MRNILIIIFLLCGVSFSAPAVGTTVGATVVPTDSTDIYAVMDAVWGRDGWRSVADTAARNAITAERRREGMVVFVRSDSTLWQLRGGIANAYWKEFISPQSRNSDSLGHKPPSYYDTVGNGMLGGLYLKLDQTTPQSVINGDPYFTSGLKTPNIYPNADGATALQIMKADGSTPIVTFNTTSGYLGIGMTPTFPLDVTGNARLLTGNLYLSNNYGIISRTSTGTAKDVFYASSGNDVVFGATAGGWSSIQFRNGTTADKWLVWSGLYNLGIGLSDPDEKLEVTGNVRLTSDNNVYYLGTDKDAGITYDGTNMVIDPDLVGSGKLLINGVMALQTPTTDNTPDYLLCQSSATDTMVKKCEPESLSVDSARVSGISWLAYLADSTKANAPHGVTLEKYIVSNGTNKFKSGLLTNYTSAIGAGSNNFNNDGTASKGLSFDEMNIPTIVNTAEIAGDLHRSITISDDAAMAAGVGGGIALSGKWKADGSYAYFGGIRAYKANSTEGNYSGGVRISTRQNGNTPSDKLEINELGKIRFITTPPTSNGSIYTRNGDTLCVSSLTVTNLIDSLALAMKKTAFDDSIAHWINGTQNYYGKFDATGHKLENSAVHDSSGGGAEPDMTVFENQPIMKTPGIVVNNDTVITIVGGRVINRADRRLWTWNISSIIGLTETLGEKQDTAYRGIDGGRNKVLANYEYYPGDGFKMNPIMQLIYTNLYKYVLRWTGDRFVIKPEGASSDGRIAVTSKTSATAWTQSDSAGYYRFAYTDTNKVNDSTTAIADTVSLLFDKSGMIINNSAQYVIRANQSTYPLIIAKTGSSGQLFMGLSDVVGNVGSDSGGSIKMIGVNYGADNDGDIEIRAGESNIPGGKFGDIRLIPSGPGSVYIPGNTGLLFDRNGGEVEAGDSTLQFIGPNGSSGATVTTNYGSMRIRSGSGSNDGIYTSIDTVAVSDGKTIFTGYSAVIGTPIRFYGDTTYTPICSLFINGSYSSTSGNVKLKIRDKRVSIYITSNISSGTGGATRLRFSGGVPDPVDTTVEYPISIKYHPSISLVRCFGGAIIHNDYIDLTMPFFNDQGGSLTWGAGYMNLQNAIIEYEME